YISYESAPISIEQIKNIHKLFIGLSHLSKILIQKLPQIWQGTHQIFFEFGNVTLILIYNDFLSLKNFSFKADTWYLDGFSPTKNSSAWSNELYNEIYKHTKDGGSLSTYTVAGHVRRGLSDAGFNISKIKGIGNKREILYGYKNKVNCKTTKKPVLRYNDIGPVAVIGAGISGASLIYFLKKRNIDCFLIDKASTLGNGASGNKIALQIPKLTLDNSPYGILSLEAFSFSRKLAIELNAAPKSNGVVMFPSREREILKFDQLLMNNWPLHLIHNKIYNYDFLEGIKYLYLKSAGIVDNKKFIKNLIKDVKFYSKFNVKNVLNTNNGFKEIIDDKGNKLSAKTIIWANGYEMANLDSMIPILPVSGQVSYLSETADTSKLKLNFSYGHFLSQSFQGFHQIGASFNRIVNTNYSEIDQIQNIESIPNFLKKTFNTDIQIEKKYRTSVRGSTKDRFPLCGSLSDLKGQESNNIYFLGGMGAWGFVYAPYYADFLIKSILNEPVIIEENLKKIISIKRFL
ncbi:FAD-dependent 5-carboxymethylaminomethyl-2-thiouridine(34) oxidoreductase MnmC, partial [Alphaproteobacteria bacterium]|nr:FAD-dependent 5-carboxymethylaminomethyl-2-thiouridine(34) oxidoreductase MnmC [Alphaproteobacteria bacterium]